MATETFTKVQFWAELDQLGEDKVRERVVTGAYSTVKKRRQLAEEWLRLKDQERADESARLMAASQSEQLEIARSAKDAAWEAARAAKDANTHAASANKIAVAAAIMAVISIAVSMFGLLRGN